MSRQRSVPSYLTEYLDDGGSGEDNHSSDEDADEGTKKKKKKISSKQRGKAISEGKKRAAAARAAAVAAQQSSARPRRQSAIAASSLAAAAAAESDEEMRPVTARSARLQGVKRKTYEEPDEEEFNDSEDNEEEEGREEEEEQQEAAVTRRPVGVAKKPKRAAPNVQYLDLNGCLGKSQIDRILARRRMPAPDTFFLSSFIAQLPLAQQERLHPEDMRRFAPAMYDEHKARIKEQEARAVEEERRKAEQSTMGLQGVLTLSRSLSLDSAAAAPADDTAAGSFRGAAVPGEDEYYYLIKWKHRGYSPLALHWLPHSLLMLFEDGAARVRRYEQTRVYGETRGVARLSKSDEELEEDDQHTIRLARAIRGRTMDEDAIRAAVVAKEEDIRAHQEALRPQTSTLTSLLSTVLPESAAEAGAGDAETTTAAAATGAGVAAIDPAAASSSAASSSAISSSSTAAASSSAAAPAAAAAVVTPAAPLTSAQLRELEHSLESGRIARRLADISNDHKLARFKKINVGFFDADYACVERVIGHRRRMRSSRQARFFFSPSTVASHWSYYGITTPGSIRQVERLLSGYVVAIDAHIKRFMYELAENIDPRVRLLRTEWERLLSPKTAIRPPERVKDESDARSSTPVAKSHGVKEEGEAEKEEEKKSVQKDKPREAKQAIAPAKLESAASRSAVWMDDGDDEKDESVSKAAAAAAAKDDGPSAVSSRPSRAAAAAGRARLSARPSPPPAHAPSPSPAFHSSGRPRRAASARGRVRLRDSLERDDDMGDGVELHSEDDEDLQTILRASEMDARKKQKPIAAAAATADEDAPMMDDPDYNEDKYDPEEEGGFEDGEDDDEDVDHERFEFLVKWVQLPYELCTWETRSDLRRLDDMQKRRTEELKPEGSTELNPSVPLPSLSMLPFMPLSSLLFANNLLLKYADLPIVVPDEQYSSTKALAAQGAHKAALHPTVALSIVQQRDPELAAGAAAAVPGRPIAPPAAARISGITALHRYLLTHSSRTKHSSVVYPLTKGHAGPNDLIAARTVATVAQAPASFTMQAAAVSPDQRFGRNQELSLRGYQNDGINWLALNWSAGRNSILADEMGLGKTVQCSLLLSWMVTRQQLTQPILIVAPLSTLGFWLREVERWTELYGVIYRGGPESRKIIRAWDWKWPTDNAEMDELDELRKEEGVNVEAPSSSSVSSSAPLHRRPYKFNVLITSYEFILSDFSLLSRVNFSTLVVDEAQRLKSSTSKLFERLQQFRIARKLLLTGTPIQNNLEELWCLLHFIEPLQFASVDDFLHECGEMNTLAQVTKLFHFLRPVVLRRLKSDVEKSLPTKEEILVEVPLTALQKRYYRAVYERNYKVLAAIKRTDGTKQIQSLRNISMQLRKVSQHPYLMDGCEREELESLQAALPAGQHLTQDAIMEALVSSSGKFQVLDKLLPKLKHEGHRVLIFSQMTRVLDIIQDYLHYRRYKHERLDGNVPTAERQLAIDKFSEPNSDIFAFLLSTRAGGLGITLTAADTVILFDSDWNLQNDIQAQDRAHRIGQVKPVVVYRLLTKNTYESQMFERSCLKLTLDRVVMATLSQHVTNSDQASEELQRVGGGVKVGGRGRKKQPAIGAGPDPSFGGKDDSADSPFNKNEVEEMLKHGAYNIFSDKNSAESELKSIQFAEEDIDRILQRSQVVKYQSDAAVPNGEGAIKVELVPLSEADASSSFSAAAAAAAAAAPSAKSGGSTFSKASFVPKGGGESLEMSDPLFWQKLGMQDKSVTEVNLTDAAEVLDGKRVRKPAQVFNAGDGAEVEEEEEDEEDNSARRSNSSMCGAAGGRTSVPHCPICTEPARFIASNPTLECAICEEQSHLTCLGLGAMPPEDEWHCPACVRDGSTSKKKTTTGKARVNGGGGGEDDEDDDDYKPDPRKKFAYQLQQPPHLSAASTSSSSGATTAPPTKVYAPRSTVAPSSLVPVPAPPSAHAQAVAHRKQYMRLLGTYRLSQPGKSERHYRELADAMWKTVFKCDPPTEDAAADAAATKQPAKQPPKPAATESKKAGPQKQKALAPKPATTTAAAPPVRAPREPKQKRPVVADPSTVAPSAAPLSQSPYAYTQPMVSLNDPYAAAASASYPLYSGYSTTNYAPSYSSVYDGCAGWSYPYATNAYQPQYVSAMQMDHSQQVNMMQPQMAMQSTSMQQPHSLPSPIALRPTPTAPAPTAAAIDPSRVKCNAASCSKLDGEPGVPAFNLCGKCRRARYCSRDCQAADWKAGHKRDCK